MAADPLLFLTGYVSTIFPPVQATKKIWHQELVLSMAGRNQPAEGLVKIQFAEQHMRLLGGLRLGEYVTVGFTVRGMDYYWEGTTKYLVVLMGQQLAITPEPGQRKKSSGRRVVPNIATTDFSARSAPVSFPPGHELGDEPPF